MSTEERITCQLCGDKVDRLIYHFHFDSEKKVLDLIEKSNPGWVESNGACSRCYDYYSFQTELGKGNIPESGPFFPVKSVDDFIIVPTPIRLNVNPKYSGKGITICFIDSGFYPHPDLNNRIKIIVDITNSKNKKSYFNNSHPESWHGMMTSSVCCGNGLMSDGLYKGIASDAELVLLKVQDKDGKISTANIVRALQWVIRNHKKYQIRIINLSLGDDFATSIHESEIDKLAEKAISKGIVIVAAVGNEENASIKPPANAENVIAVGGLNDNNRLENTGRNLYHSTYGKTIDGLIKPELIAHSCWIAAPILPGTFEKAEAEALHEIVSKGDAQLKTILNAKIHLTQLDLHLKDEDSIPEIRQRVTSRIQQTKYFSKDYVHVDGTSFAAPIVSSVIAQMLEANPELTPLQVREIICSTATKLEEHDIIRQGYGLIHPRKAIVNALQQNTLEEKVTSPILNTKKNTISFYTRSNCASKVVLSGSFNNWEENQYFLEPIRNGVWGIEIPMLDKGEHLYKFLIDDKDWTPDMNNPYREPDGYNHWNSKLIIK